MLVLVLGIMEIEKYSLSVVWDGFGQYSGGGYTLPSKKLFVRKESLKETKTKRCSISRTWCHLRCTRLQPAEWWCHPRRWCRPRRRRCSRSSREGGNIKNNIFRLTLGFQTAGAGARRDSRLGGKPKYVQENKKKRYMNGQGVPMMPGSAAALRMQRIFYSTFFRAKKS